MGILCPSPCGRLPFPRVARGGWARPRRSSAEALGCSAAPVQTEVSTTEQHCVRQRITSDLIAIVGGLIHSSAESQLATGHSREPQVSVLDRTHRLPLVSGYHPLARVPTPSESVTGPSPKRGVSSPAHRQPHPVSSHTVTTVSSYHPAAHHVGCVNSITAQTEICDHHRSL